ncbi:MAG: SoxR reducing system RseC family protein [Elusimicrobiota bacterium]
MKTENKLKAKGTVLKFSQGSVQIKIFRPVECEGCGACLGAKENILRLPTKREFKPGEEVWLILSCASLTSISLLLYFLPAVFALAGFIGGYFWLGDIGGLLGAVLFLIMSYIGVKKYSSSKDQHIIEIEKKEE